MSAIAPSKEPNKEPIALLRDAIGIDVRGCDHNIPAADILATERAREA